MKKIVNDYIISEFDCDEPERYVLSYSGKYWNISKHMKLVIENINECDSPSELQVLIKEKYGENIAVNLIETVYNDFLVKNNFFEDAHNDSDMLKLAKNDLLWGRFTLVSEKNISKLKMLIGLFSKRVMTINISIFFVINFLCIFFFHEQLTLITKDLFFERGVIKCILINAVVIFIHEYGHATATLKFGLNPKRIGGAFYFVKPVMFTDVTSTWALPRNQRQVVNFGGIYFQLIASYILLIFFACIGDIQSLNITIISELFIFANFNIFIKSDGYWMLSDYLGVSNLHMEISSFIKKVFSKKALYGKRKEKVLLIYLIAYVFAIIIMLWIIGCNLFDAASTIILALNSGINRNNIGTFMYGIVICILFIYGMYKLSIRIIKIRKYSK